MLFYCLRNYQPNSSEFNSRDKFLVIDMDSCRCWGFADRIRGALYLLNVSKNLGLKVYIKFTKPFNLNKYYHFNDASFLPSEKISSTVNFDAINCAIPYTSNVSPNEIFKTLLSYTNADCVYLGTNIFDYPSMSVYSDFFTRTNYFSEIILNHKKIIGFNYISISFRFQGKLGDFLENGNDSLTEKEQLSLMEKCKCELQSFIKDEANNRSVLVLSDSSRFLNFVKNLPSVYVFPDSIQHMCHMTSDSSEDTFLKTLLDFNLIMDADESYLFVTEYLYHSGFPVIASLCSGRTCIVHRF